MVGDGALLVTEHGGCELPGGGGTVAPRRGDDDHAIESGERVEMEKIGVAANQFSGVFGGRLTDFDESAIDGDFFVR